MRVPISRILKSASLPRDILLTLVGALLGLATSHLYYLQTISDMSADVEERKRIDELIFRGIESAGSMTYVRDESGKVIGVQIHLHAAGGAQALGSATPTAPTPIRRQ